MQNYQQAEEYLQKGRDGDYRPLNGRATTLESRGPDAIAVRYHETDVVTFHRDGRIVLTSGGWRTSTTKERINEYSPATISQRGGLWYIMGPYSAGQGRAELGLFEDGLTVDEHGAPVSVLDSPAALEAAKRKVDKLVARYVTGYCQHLRKVGHVEPPGPGDCWYCLMRTVDGNKPLGDATGDVDHLLGHLDERYYVPSLLVNAIDERRYGGGVGFIVALINNDLERARTDRYSLYHVKHDLRAYFSARKLALAELIRLRESYSVGDAETGERLGLFATEQEASAYIATLPDHEDGRYYLDAPQGEE